MCACVCAECGLGGGWLNNPGYKRMQRVPQLYRVTRQSIEMLRKHGGIQEREREKERDQATKDTNNHGYETL